MTDDARRDARWHQDVADWTTKDSGRREQWDTGAKRDTREGKGRYDLLNPLAIRRLAGVYERGAAKYDDRNYEKGIPLSRFIDSALRHTFQLLEGNRDEDHAAQAAWNLLAYIATEEMVARGLLPKDLDNMPNYSPVPEPVAAGTAEDHAPAPGAQLCTYENWLGTCTGPGLYLSSPFGWRCEHHFLTPSNTTRPE